MNVEELKCCLKAISPTSLSAETWGRATEASWRAGARLASATSPTAPCSPRRRPGPAAWRCPARRCPARLPHCSRGRWAAAVPRCRGFAWTAQQPREEAQRQPCRGRRAAEGGGQRRPHRSRGSGEFCTLCWHRTSASMAGAARAPGTALPSLLPAAQGRAGRPRGAGAPGGQGATGAALETRAGTKPCEGARRMSPLLAPVTSLRWPVVHYSHQSEPEPDRAGRGGGPCRGGVQPGAHAPQRQPRERGGQQKRAGEGI